MTAEEFRKSKEDKAKSVLSGEKNINGLKVRFVNIDFLKSGDRRQGKQSSSNVVHASDRVFVLAEFNGIRIPFYISTGDGGKEKVPVGKWYPIFGHMGWVNKGTQEEINDAYGSKALKDIKNWLDQNVGFLGETDDNGYFGLTSETRASESVGDAKVFYDSLNRDLRPTERKFIWRTPEEKLQEQKNIQLGKQHMIDLVAKATGENKVEYSSDISSSSVGVLKNYIVSKCKGDAYEIFLWSQGKSIVNNPPVEIRNIIMGMNPKVTGSNFVIDNIDAVNYFKAWVPMKTLGDEAFEYILDNNEDYLKLYRDFGRPTGRQNIEIIKKLETEGFDSDNFKALEKAEQQFKSSKAIRKIRF
jgi:hypothetical protein